MSQSEVFQRKLARFQRNRLAVRIRRLEWRKQRHSRKTVAAQEKRRAAKRKAELYARVKRLQKYRCGICRRHMSECGRKHRDIYPDYFQRRMLRGFLCANCKLFISKHKEQPEALLSDDSKEIRLRRRAVAYLSEWPALKV